MSYLVFKNDLLAQDLDLARFQKIFEFGNRKDKSILIEDLTTYMGSKFHEKAKNGDINTVIIPKDEVATIVIDFENDKIKNKFPPCKSILKSIPMNGITDLMYDQRTNFAFKNMKLDNGNKEWVVIQVYMGGKLYDLNLNHIMMCISNGWYFCIPKDKYPQISCVFRVYGQ